MKVLLCAFSGTGNTFLAMDAIKKHFIETGNEVVAYQFFSKTEAPSLEGYDLIGLGYPIHAFNVPKVFLSFVKKFPFGNGKKYFIFKVSGEPFHLNDSSSYKMAHFLDKHGYIRVYEKHFLMPYNIMFRYPNRLEKQMYLYLDPLAKCMVQDILSTKKELINYHLWSRFVSFFFRIEYLAPILNRPFVHISKKKCLKCQKCLKLCPTSALYIGKNGRIKMGKGCALCMGCVFSCPNNAIFFGFMNSWKIKGGFSYESLVNDKSIDPAFISSSTKGYYRHFTSYFHQQEEILKAHNVISPIHYQKSISK